MQDSQNIVKEIKRVETITLNVKQEIKTLKNRVRAYKGWTKRYRQQQKELKRTNLIVCQEKERAIQELEVKQQCLLETVEEARQAKELRDKALSQLDEVIAKIEQYKEICDRANQITYANKTYLIKEAEKLFFDDPVINLEFKLDSREKPQMFTDKASVARSLLDR